MPFLLQITQYEVLGMEYGDGHGTMDSENDSSPLTSGEMVQLLIHNLKDYGHDLRSFEAFLDRFSRENAEFLKNINDIFVCTVHRQCVRLAEILMCRFLPGRRVATFRIVLGRRCIGAVFVYSRICVLEYSVFCVSPSSHLTKPVLRLADCLLV